MIQRPQSLFLLAAAVLLVVFLLSLAPWASLLSAGTGWLLPVVYGLGSVTAAGALIATGLFKNRTRQRTVISWVRWLCLVLVAFVAAGLFVASRAAVIEQATIVTSLLPLVAYVLLRLALRGVQKDIDLVRSADRLR
jgi:hypothetical protein